MVEVKEIIKVEGQKSKIKWTSYLATAYAEGFCEGEGGSFEEQIEAWAVLIKTGICWGLQGWFGRNAQNFIDSGAISNKGVINWGYAEEFRG